MRIIAYVVAALLLFTGCAQDQPKEPAPTAKPSPTATVPSMPAAAKENTVAGAVAFVEHYIDVFNYASNTGDVKELQKLSDPKCEGCTSYIDLYKKTYADGGYFRGSDWQFSEATVDTRDGALVVFGHISAPSGVYKVRTAANQQAGKTESFDATYLPFHAAIGWQITNFGKQETKPK